MADDALAKLTLVRYSTRRGGRLPRWRASEAALLPAAAAGARTPHLRRGGLLRAQLRRCCRRRPDAAELRACVAGSGACSCVTTDDGPGAQAEWPADRVRTTFLEYFRSKARRASHRRQRAAPARAGRPALQPWPAVH